MGWAWSPGWPQSGAHLWHTGPRPCLTPMLSSELMVPNHSPHPGFQTHPTGKGRRALQITFFICLLDGIFRACTRSLKRGERQGRRGSAGDVWRTDPSVWCRGRTFPWGTGDRFPSAVSIYWLPLLVPYLACPHLRLDKMVLGTKNREEWERAPAGEVTVWWGRQVLCNQIKQPCKHVKFGTAIKNCRHS